VNRFSVSGMVMAGPFGCPGGGCTGRPRQVAGADRSRRPEFTVARGVVGRLSADLGAGQARDSAGTARLATVRHLAAHPARVPCPV